MAVLTASAALATKIPGPVTLPVLIAFECGGVLQVYTVNRHVTDRAAPLPQTSQYEYVIRLSNILNVVPELNKYAGIGQLVRVAGISRFLGLPSDQRIFDAIAVSITNYSAKLSAHQLVPTASDSNQVDAINIASPASMGPGFYAPSLSKISVEAARWVEYVVGATMIGADSKLKPEALYKRLRDPEIFVGESRHTSGVLQSLLVGYMLKQQNIGQIGSEQSPLSVVIVPTLGPKSPTGSKFVDMFSAQAAYKNAMFMVSSATTGLPDRLPTTPFNPIQVLTSYAIDQTQGKSAAISAGAATIMRLCTGGFGESLSTTAYAQTHESVKQFNMLRSDDIKRYFPVQNGYVTLDKDTPQLPPTVMTGTPGSSRDAGTISQDALSLMGNIKVLTQVGTEVIFGGTADNGGSFIPLYDRVLINQVFCHPICYDPADQESGVPNARFDSTRVKSRFLLHAMYASAGLAAVWHKNETLVLTMLGAGAFNNNIGDILSAIVFMLKILASIKDLPVKRIILPLTTGVAGAFSDAVDAREQADAIAHRFETNYSFNLVKFSVFDATQ